MLNDTLAIALSNIMSYEKIGNKEVLVKPSSRLIKELIALLNTHGFV